MKKAKLQQTIKTVKDFENYLLKHFDAYISSVEEVNTFTHYCLIGDNEHNYNDLAGVYKILGENADLHAEHQEIFTLIFAKNGKIYDSKSLGMHSEKVGQMWKLVEWAD